MTLAEYKATHRRVQDLLFLRNEAPVLAPFINNDLREIAKLQAEHSERLSAEAKAPYAKNRAPWK